MPSPEYPVKQWMEMVEYGNSNSEIRHRILTTIISHPTEVSTETELLYVISSTKSRSEEDVLLQLEILCEAGLLTQYVEDDYTFYGVTERGMQFMADSKYLRTKDVWERLYQNLERTSDIQTAYDADRPVHPPSEKDYEETEYPRSSDWEAAREATFRDLKFTLDRVSKSLFHANLVEQDEGRTIASRDISVDESEEVDEVTQSHQTQMISERRGHIAPDDAYSFEIEEDYKTIVVTPEKDGDRRYGLNGHQLYIFLEKDEETPD